MFPVQVLYNPSRKHFCLIYLMFMHAWKKYKEMSFLVTNNNYQNNTHGEISMPCCHMNFKSHIVVAYYYLMRCSHNAHISFFATSTCVSYISFVCEKYESVNCESTIVSKIIMHDTKTWDNNKQYSFVQLFQKVFCIK